MAGETPVPYRGINVGYVWLWDRSDLNFGRWRGWCRLTDAYTFEGTEAAAREFVLALAMSRIDYCLENGIEVPGLGPAS